MELSKRIVNTFRAQVDPMIGPKPRNAFVPAQMGMEAHLIDCGVYVKVLPSGTFQGSEHIVPFANIQSIRLEPEPINIHTGSSVETLDHSHDDLALTISKRKPGRPVGS